MLPYYQLHFIGNEGNNGSSIVAAPDVLHSDCLCRYIYDPPKRNMSIAEEAGCRTMNGLVCLSGRGPLRLKFGPGRICR